MCSSKPPRPDPQIGAAAKQNADIAASMRDIAKENLAWERERSAKQDPLMEKIVNQQIESGEQNAARADEQWQIYRDLFHPVEQKMLDDAMSFDSEERKDRMAAEAGADTGRSYQAMQEQNARQMGRLGVNPNSGKFAALTNATGLAQAKDTAGAMNQARRNTELLGMSQRQSAANFGRNMPNTGLAADAAALQGGNSAIGGLGASNAARNASMNSAAQWFGGAQAGNQSAANIGLGLYQGQLQANQQKQDAMGGIGSLIGTLGTAAAIAKIRKGGLIRKGAVVRYNPLGHRGGLSSLKRRGYAEGGMIEGPGTGTSDSIPAVIEGKQPAALSNGEAVLNTGAVSITGEDFVHRINQIGQALNESQGGLAMLSRK